MCAESEMPKITLGITGLRKLLRGDDEIEEPHRGLPEQ